MNAERTPKTNYIIPKRNSHDLHLLLRNEKSISGCSVLTSNYMHARALGVHIPPMTGVNGTPFSAVKEEQADFLHQTLTTINPDSRVTGTKCGKCFLQEFPQAYADPSIYPLYCSLPDRQNDGIPTSFLYLDNKLAVKDISELYEYVRSRLLPPHRTSGRCLSTLVHECRCIVECAAYEKKRPLEEARALGLQKRIPFPDQDV